MDLEEWEILSDDGLLEFHPKDGKVMLSRESGIIDPKGVIEGNYFICPSPAPRRHIETPNTSTVSRGRKQLVPVPIRFKPMVDKNPDQELVKDIREVPNIEISVAPPVVLEMIKDPKWAAADQDMISQVFFKTMKENEFVDMKVDSPKSISRELKPQIEVGPIQFEENEEVYRGEGYEHKPPKMGIDVEIGKDYIPENEEKGCWDGGGLNIWRWRVTGIGALCSFGFTAAAISMFIFGSHQRHKQQQQNQKLRVQIYADDKRMKQAARRSTKFNQALSSARGIPLTRAQISFGGYYDSL